MKDWEHIRFIYYLILQSVGVKQHQFILLIELASDLKLNDSTRICNLPGYAI